MVLGDKLSNYISSYTYHTVYTVRYYIHGNNSRHFTQNKTHFHVNPSNSC